MRYVLAAILLCAVAAPTASARPAAVSHPASSKSDATQAAKRSKAPAQREGRGGVNSGGIHPLVGSGDY
jgi:hypothetical protein